MASILSSLHKTIGVGIALTILFIIYFIQTGGSIDAYFWRFMLRYLHVLSGLMWIGLLWYFNFVQIPSMSKIPDNEKPAISKVIAPAALFWFRWAALVTIITGLTTAHLNGYLYDALALGILETGSQKSTVIGIGMWLGIIMAYNVWMIIWPNQKIALGIVNANPDDKPAAGRKAMLFSRTNTALSIPMLYAMVSAQNLY